MTATPEKARGLQVGALYPNFLLPTVKRFRATLNGRIRSLEKLRSLLKRSERVIVELAMCNFGVSNPPKLHVLKSKLHTV
jgi:hypothetical protein